MNVTEFAVTAEEAEAKLDEYEGVPEARRTPFDGALVRAYRAARRGMTLLHLSSTIEAGGRFDSGLPKLAIARALSTTCWVGTRTWPHPSLLFGSNEMALSRWKGASVSKHVVSMGLPEGWARLVRGGRTTVPLVPPAARPPRGNLAGFHVLWEVEDWAEVPPIDPYLVRHLMGDLWVVHAEWLLTDLEQAVLARGRVHL